MDWADEHWNVFKASSFDVVVCVDELMKWGVMNLTTLLSRFAPCLLPIAHYLPFTT
jgi:hypothetical protein